MLQHMFFDVGNHSVQMAGLPSGEKEDVRTYDNGFDDLNAGGYDDHDADEASANHHHHPKHNDLYIGYAT